MSEPDATNDEYNQRMRKILEETDRDHLDLLDLSNKTGYEIVQENGQRKYGGPPPDWGNADPPPKGSEVFVGKLPRDCFEPELVPIFEKIGKIYEMRLMMDFSGSNRGYAFVMYTNPNDAKRAIKELNNYEIRRGKYLGVVKSVDNCRLFVGGIPRTKSKDEIFEELRRVTDGVVDVILYRAVADKTKSRGFAFVEYDSHKAAAMARRRLLPGRLQLWGSDIAVDWAEPEPEVDSETMSRVRVLYFRNLMLETSEDTLLDVCCQIRAGSVEKVKKMRDYAFVHFTNREDAQCVMEALNETELDGSVIQVTWAKPVDRLMRPINTRRSAGPSDRYSPGGGGAMTAVGVGIGAGGGASGGAGDYAAAPYMFPAPAHQGQSYAPAWPAHPMQPLVPFTTVNGRYGPVLYYRGRGRGAAGLRTSYVVPGFRGRGYARGPPEPQRVNYATDMGLVPNSASHVLQNMCQKNDLGEPSYQMLTGPLFRDQLTNRMVPLFSCKVTIPGLPDHVFQPTKFSPSVEDARNFAAEYALTSLFGNTFYDGEDEWEATPSVTSSPPGSRSFTPYDSPPSERLNRSLRLTNPEDSVASPCPSPDPCAGPYPPLCPCPCYDHTLDIPPASKVINLGTFYSFFPYTENAVEVAPREKLKRQKTRPSANDGEAAYGHGYYAGPAYGMPPVPQIY